MNKNIMLGGVALLVSLSLAGSVYAEGDIFHTTDHG